LEFYIYKPRPGILSGVSQYRKPEAIHKQQTDLKNDLHMQNYVEFRIAVILVSGQCKQTHFYD